MSRIRRVGSISSELLKKSKEAALAAVQIFNNPNITFKSESFIVLTNIAWTYLLHAYYKKNGIEYRYFEQKGKCLCILTNSFDLFLQFSTLQKLKNRPFFFN